MKQAHHQSGWTLLELAVVLVVMALLATVLLPLLPLGARLSAEEQAQRDMQQAEQALLGYLRTHLRLPMADVNVDGKEDAAYSGLLPVSTLGLSSDVRLGYRVNTQLVSLPTANAYAPPLPVVAGVNAPTDTNGLDLCVKLGITQRLANSVATVEAGTGFQLVAGIGSDGQMPDISVFAVPNAPASSSPDLIRSALGVGELYARLGCPDRVARTHAAAQAAVSAQSAVQLAQLQHEFRQFNEEVARMDIQNARTGIAFSEFDLALGALEVAMATVQMIMDIPPDDAFEAAVAAIELATASAQLGLTIKEYLIARGADLDEAEEAEQTAISHTATAQQQWLRMQQLRDAATRSAANLDKMELMP